MIFKHYAHVYEASASSQLPVTNCTVQNQNIQNFGFFVSFLAKVSFVAPITLLENITNFHRRTKEVLRQNEADKFAWTRKVHYSSLLQS